MAASVASVRALEQKVERWMKRVNRTLEELSKSSVVVVESSTIDVEEKEECSQMPSSSSSPIFFYNEVVPTQPFDVSLGNVGLDTGVYLLQAEVTLANTDVTENASAIIGLFVNEECIAKSASSWSGRWDGSESGRGMQTVRIQGRWSVAMSSQMVSISLRTIARHATSVMITHEPLFPVKVWAHRFEK